jgi:outer membrane protein TolC
MSAQCRESKNNFTQAMIAFMGLALALLAQGVRAQDTTGPLDLEGYLKQIKAGNPAFRSAQLSAEGAQERSGEGGLAFSPQLFSDFSYIYNTQTPFPIGFNWLTNQNYQAGVSYQAPFGLRTRAYYKILVYEAEGFPPAFGNTRPLFYEGSTNFEFAFPLWRGLFGGEARAQRDAAEAGANAARYASSFQSKGLLAAGEAGYWRLALARENVRVQREAMETAKKMLEWARRRAGLQLGDRSDVYQMEAAYDLRSLQLQSALDEERAASLEFNSNRGSKSEVVEEKLIPLTRDLLANLQIPERAQFRDDVLAAEQQKKAAEANARLGLERNSPKLDLSATASFWQRSEDFSTAIGQSFSTRHPSGTVALNFQVPFDIPTVLSVRSGFHKELEAADLTFQRKVFDQEKEWTDIVKKLDEAKRRYELSQKIEKIQSEKFDYERDRLTRGRTTTLQVLTFEQDLRTAQLTRIQSQAAILNLVAQMKTFGGSSQ